MFWFRATLIITEYSLPPGFPGECSKLQLREEEAIYTQVLGWGWKLPFGVDET